jgi:hypothetical protein
LSLLLLLLLSFALILLSSLPLAIAESPAVTLSYYWTYKVRCTARRRRAAGGACHAARGGHGRACCALRFT